MKPRILLMLLLVLFTLLLAACGGGGDDDDEDEPTTDAGNTTEVTPEDSASATTAPTNTPAASATNTVTFENEQGDSVIVTPLAGWVADEAGFRMANSQTVLELEDEATLESGQIRLIVEILRDDSEEIRSLNITRFENAQQVLVKLLTARSESGEVTYNNPLVSVPFVVGRATASLISNTVTRGESTNGVVIFLMDLDNAYVWMSFLGASDDVDIRELERVGRSLTRTVVYTAGAPAEEPEDEDTTEATEEPADDAEATEES
jgi:hypothetical protein